MNILKEFVEIFFFLNIVAAIVLLVLIFKIFSKVKTLSKNLEPVGEGIDYINKNIDEFNLKKEKIQYTREHSIPLFVRLFFIFTVLRAAIKDFRDTKSSRRSLRKSLNKAYRYESTLRENRLLKRG